MNKKYLIKIGILAIGLVMQVKNSSAQTYASGVYHSLAVCNDSSVKSWGRNNNGQLGNGNFTNSSSAVSVSNLTGIIAVAAGEGHSMALKSDGTVWTWGSNQFGQLGDGTNTSSSIPVKVVNLTDIKAIAAGYGHSMALKNDGTVWLWGDGYFQQLGTGSLGSNTPVSPSGLNNVMAIASGQGHCLALKTDSTLWAWGSNQYGQVGNGTTTDQASPVKVFEHVKSMDGGLDHTIALRNDGVIWSWGRNGFYQLGITGNLNKSLPTQSNISNVSKLATGYNHNIAVKKDGTVWTWGRNNYGQLGNGNTTSIIVPYQLTTLTNTAAQIDAGWAFTTVVKSDKTIASWGSNTNGELCDGTNTDHYSPTAAIGMCQVLSVSGSTGIAENNKQLEFELFPNPSNGKFYIQTQGSSDYTIEIYNMTGEKKMFIKNSNFIELNEISSGLYVLRLSYKNKYIYKKIIIE